jgi:hypothetical protein
MPVPQKVEPRVPSAARLLDVWDAARGLVMPRRAKMLVALACPSLPDATIVDLPLGHRDSLLLSWRRLLLGDTIDGVAQCPKCAETVETQFSPAALAMTAGAAVDTAGELDLAGQRVRYRLPTVADAIALAETTRADGRALLARCIIGADGDALPDSALPESALVEIADRIAQADPCADILLDLTCPSCAHRWSAPFDTVAVLWAEIDAWAQRTLHEVVAIAGSFGWSEADILALSPQRRADYLALSGR